MLKREKSRKRLNSAANGNYNDLVAQRQKQVTPHGFSDLATKTITCRNPDGPKQAYLSSASYVAHDPQTDLQFVKGEKDHLFGAVIKQVGSARGGNYLKQHLYEEMLAQVPKHNHNLAAALQAAIRELDRGFQSLHPFNKAILEGVHLAAAFVDLTTLKLHVASNIGCRCIVGRNTEGGNAVEIAANVGKDQSTEDKSDLEESSQNIIEVTHFADIQLEHDVDTIILGSTGFWREVAPFKAILRAHHFYKTSPHAMKGNAAASIVNYGLHVVTQRLRFHKDRRMYALKSVTNLVSLHTGDKSQFKWGHKQPVRRRRGDVHDDMTVVVMHLDWEGQNVANLGQKKTSHWDAVRMVFNFYKASVDHTHKQWFRLSDQLRSTMTQPNTKRSSCLPAEHLELREFRKYLEMDTSLGSTCSSEASEASKYEM